MYNTVALKNDKTTAKDFTVVLSNFTVRVLLFTEALSNKKRSVNNFTVVLKNDKASVKYFTVVLSNFTALVLLFTEALPNKRGPLNNFTVALNNDKGSVKYFTDLLSIKSRWYAFASDSKGCPLRS